jgi:hypothetical protein
MLGGSKDSAGGYCKPSLAGVIVHFAYGLMQNADRANRNAGANSDVFKRRLEWIQGPGVASMD